MALNDNLTREVKKILGETWSVRDGQVVPEPEDLRLSNDGVKLNATVLYADLAESTDLVNSHSAEFAAVIYKVYLHCATKIIRHYGGAITAFDGDRVMGIYLGNMKNTNAVRTGLAINHAVIDIINPAIGAQYGSESYRVKHAVGVETSSILAARTGIRDDNDLVWVGRSANFAAKLCSLRESTAATWITSDVYNKIEDSVKTADGNSMWAYQWWAPGNIYVYGSRYHWAAD